MAEYIVIMNIYLHYFKLAKYEWTLTKFMFMRFLDGRDVNPQSALDYIEQTETKMEEIGVGKFAISHRTLLCDGP